MLAFTLGAAIAQRALKATDDKLFFIGPNKTGTTSIAELFRTLGYRSCHRHCHRQDMTWADATRTRNASYFEDADVFVDVGDVADFIWLSKQYPTARFVYNTRPLTPWLISRVDMYRKVREKHGCLAYGVHELGDKCGPVGLSANDHESILRFVVRVAAVQEATLIYFLSSPALSNRFVLHDFTASSPTTKALIDWITRSDLGSNSSTRLVLSAADLPTGGSAAGGRVALPHKYKYGEHVSQTVKLVTETLKNNDCLESWHADVWYAKCAAGILRHRPDLKESFQNIRRRKLRGAFTKDTGSSYTAVRARLKAERLLDRVVCLKGNCTGAGAIPGYLH
jgi:hypothetical protein